MRLKAPEPPPRCAPSRRCSGSRPAVGRELKRPPSRSPSTRPIHAPLLLALSLALSGCLGGIGPSDCGESVDAGFISNAPLGDAAGDRKVTEADGKRLFSWNIGAELACRDQHIKYTAEALLARVEALLALTCQDVKPPVVVTEIATAGSTEFGVEPKTRSAGDDLYRRRSDIGLAQAKGDTPWYLYLEVKFPVGDSPDEDTERAKQRIKSVSMLASYLLLKGMTEK